MPGDAEPVGRRQNDLLYVLVRFGRARARLIEVEAPAGLLAKAAKLAQVTGDRRTETLRLAHASADVETGEIANGERAHREPERRHGGIDLLRQRALKQHALGLDRTDAVHTVADKAVADADHDRRLADLA